MKTRLAALVINKLIIHEVPVKKADGSAAPTYSEIESELNDELALFFSEKVKSGAGASNAFDVCFDPGQGSPVPEIIRQALTDVEAKNFVAHSQSIAKHLFEIQTRANSGGLLTIVDCTFGTFKGIAILKVEKEEGVRLDQKTVQGKPTFDIQYVKDLLFTKKTRLFKIGLFVNLGADKTGSPKVEGVVSDPQNTSNSEIAKFFLTKFLGCMLVQAPAVTTKAFFEAVQTYANDQIDDPEKKAELYNHLLSDLSNQRERINVTEFANSYLETDLRQPFIDNMRQNGIPANSFPKDIELISAKIKKMSVEFASGILLSGSRDAMSQKVRFETLQDGAVKVEFEDKIDKVK